MIAAFLHRRKMSFKVNASRSRELPVKGGSPQGTRLGNLLFIITISKIEDNSRQVPDRLLVAAGREEDDADDCYGLRTLVGRIGAIRRFDSGVVNASTPQNAGMTDGVLRGDKIQLSRMRPPP